MRKFFIITRVPKVFLFVRSFVPKNDVFGRFLRMKTPTNQSVDNLCLYILFQKQYLLTIGSVKNKTNQKVRSFLKKIMPDDVAVEYSFLGQKEKLSWVDDCPNTWDILKGIKNCLWGLVYIIIFFTYYASVSGKYVFI